MMFIIEVSLGILIFLLDFASLDTWLIFDDDDNDDKCMTRLNNLWES